MEDILEIQIGLINKQNSQRKPWIFQTLNWRHNNNRGGGGVSESKALTFNDLIRYVFKDKDKEYQNTFRSKIGDYAVYTTSRQFQMDFED